MFPMCLDKAEINGFLITQCSNTPTHSKRTAHILFANLCSDGRQWWRGRQLGVAHHASDLFNQVFFNFQVETPTGWIDRDQTFGLCDVKTQTTQGISTLFLTERHTNHFDCACHTQSDRLADGHVQFLVIHWARLSAWRAANIDHQLGDAFDVLDGIFRIDTAFKTMPRIRRKIVAT